MRHALALLTAAGILASLTSCSSAGATTASGPCTPLSSGGSSSLVEVAGAFGEQPEVDFPTPLVATDVQRTVAIEGEGEPLRQGQPVAFEATLIDGADGTVLDSTIGAAAQAGQPVPPGVVRTVGTPSIPAIGAALECATVGSRLVIVAPGDQSVPEGSEAPDGSIVIVLDVLDAFKAKADGRTRLPQSGLPSIALAPDGTPGVTIPAEDPPTTYRKSVLKSGYGDEIADDDIAVVKYTAVDWTGRTVQGSSWLDGEGVLLDLREEGLPDGLRDAVVGERVGSQVLAVIPATDGGPALVYVLDILGTRDH